MHTYITQDFELLFDVLHTTYFEVVDKMEMQYSLLRMHFVSHSLTKCERREKVATQRSIVSILCMYVYVI